MAALPPAPAVPAPALPAPYPIPAGRSRAELVVSRSRFIATADCVPTVGEARAVIAQLKAEFAGATHNVYAFAVGFGSSVTHGSSDDGEPSGTAGRPVLAVLRGSGLGDVIVVVTRFYGGTKLGTGGLVRAYTEAAQTVLADAPRTLKIARRTVRMVLAYGHYETVGRLVAAWEGQVEGEIFGEQVTVTASFRVDRLAGFAAALGEATAGQGAVELLEEGEILEADN